MKRTLKAPEEFLEGWTVEFRSIATPTTRVFVAKVVEKICDDYYLIEDRFGYERIVAANRLQRSEQKFMHVNLIVKG